MPFVNVVSLELGVRVLAPRLLFRNRHRRGATSANSKRDEVSSPGMFMVSAFAILSALTVRLLAFLRDTFSFTNLGMKTAASQVAKDTSFGQVPHCQRWLRALCRGISVTFQKMSAKSM